MIDIGHSKWFSKGTSKNSPNINLDDVEHEPQ